MSKKRPKQAVNVEAPPSGKQPRTGVFTPDQVDESKPSWRFQIMDRDGQWHWGTLDGDDFRKIFDRLHPYETQTWKQIIGTRNNHCGSMSIENISSEAQQRLATIGHDDAPALFKFSCGGKSRVWGIKDRATLRLLWWDPDHTVYPMNITDN